MERRRHEPTDSPHWPQELLSNDRPCNLAVEPASDVVVEPSQTPRFLRLRDGDFICWKSIFLVVGGEKREITVATLSEEQ